MKDLTQGSITRHLVELSSFLAVSMLLQTLYFLVDLYFVSGLGGPAIAGVGLAGNLMMVILALTQMLGVGTTSLIAQAAGRRDRDDAQAVFDQSCVLSLLAGGLVLGGGILLRMPYCRWLSADDATVASGVPVHAVAHSLVCVAVHAGVDGIGFARDRRGEAGNVRAGSDGGIECAAGAGVDCGVGDRTPMGTAGAGLATFIAVAAGVLALTVYFVGTEKFVQVRLAGLRVHFGVWKRLLSIGLPAGGEFIMLAVYTVLVYWIIRERGAAAQAGFGIGVRLMQSLFLPVMAVSFGAVAFGGTELWSAPVRSRARNIPRGGVHGDGDHARDDGDLPPLAGCAGAVLRA
jgi:Na+-driven multidrug efflux pump